QRNGRGDQLILLVVVIPDSLNDRQRQLLKGLEETFTPENMPPREKWKDWMDGIRDVYGE
ncbi:MAG: hypothetical protein H6Q39_1843, partial [Chloroflexi bacterium]|nr:hypothetical protein [Chloroflexota bacterium]